MESLLEKIEQEIECLEPGSFVLVSEILDKYKPRNHEIELATIMLLQKYGITYRRNDK